MATKYAVDVTRRDMLLVDVEDVIVDFAKRRRTNSIPTQAEIESLARSICEVGGQQEQPVKVRRLSDNTLELVFGFTRYQAIKWWNDTHKLKGKERIPLKCIATTCNDSEAFISNIKENKERRGTTPLDDAVNQRHLKENMGWSDEEIAKLYGCTTAWVSQLRRLLVLPEPVQAEIGKSISSSAAMHMVDLPEDEQLRILKEAKTNGSVVKTSSVKDAKRNTNGSRGDTSRSIRELRAFFTAMSEPEQDEPVRKFSKAVLDYISGEHGDKALENAINRLRNGE